MKTQCYKLYSFLQASHGNWRNAIIIHCHSCPFEQNPLCSGYLMVADAEGKPLLISVDSFQEVSGELVDPSECVAVLDRSAFEAAYAQFIEWNTVDRSSCLFSQLLRPD